ncbi:MurR/RpiR family transcriptional regulator [Clostridium perfringens]
MKILSMINSLQNEFTKSEKKMSKYLLEDKELIIQSTLTELSKITDVSESTIIRLCKKFGYSGFRDFKIEFIQEVSFLKAESKEEILSGHIDENDSIETIAKKFHSINIEALNQTMDLMCYSEINKSAEMIAKAKKVNFIGIGHSGSIAQDTKYKFMRTGISTDVYIDGHTMIMMASIMDKDDLVFAISHSGNTTEVVNSIKVAKACGAKVISITCGINSKIVEFSDATIFYASAETKFQTGSLSTKIAQFFIIDLIYTEVIRNNIDKINSKIKTTKAIDSFCKNYKNTHKIL